jgi:hypothetical protein
MRLGRAVAVLIWLFVLISALLAPLDQHHPLPPIPKLIILFPAVFFATAGLLGGYPFAAPRLRAWADKRWGDGTYVRFMQDLKPMLLFGVAALTGAAACALHTYRAGAPLDDYWACGFPFSAGVGFLLGRVALAWRGLLMESRSLSAWVDQLALPRTAGGHGSLLPASIRRLRATNLTASVAGAVLVAGPSAVASLSSHIWDPASSTYRNIQLAAWMLFFFVPVSLFVIGVQHEDRHPLKEMGRTLMRGLCCMLGAAAMSAVYELLRALSR